jgi:phage shock protein C
MITGVCGGLGEYFGIDPTIVRLVWAISIFAWGSGILLYLAALLIVSVNPSQQPSSTRSGSPNVFVGGFLVLLGVVLLLHNLCVFPFFDWYGWRFFFSWRILVAGLLILLGAALVYAHFQRGEPARVETPEPGEGAQPVTQKSLRRSLSDRKLFGVCGGIAEYWSLDPSVVRLLFVVLALVSFGGGVILYVILSIIMPAEDVPAPVT